MDLNINKKSNNDFIDHLFNSLNKYIICLNNNTLMSLNIDGNLLQLKKILDGKCDTICNNCKNECKDDIINNCNKCDNQYCNTCFKNMSNCIKCNKNYK